MKNISFLSENFLFLEVRFSINMYMYLNRHVFVMTYFLTIFTCMDMLIQSSRHCAFFFFFFFFK